MYESFIKNVHPLIEFYHEKLGIPILNVIVGSPLKTAIRKSAICN